ncbi:MAG: hypothetical protein HY438_03230, partial [DPANN group archaeon]|nr:hypothetical protein [DPANN group archaeon]
MAWPDSVPQQTLELFEQKAKGIDLSGKSLEDIASAVIKVTEGFKYEWGRTRAFGNCILFPWPHEVEQLGEVFCGTKALYRFLFAKFLKNKFNLPFDAVFLLAGSHGSVGLSDGKKKYALEDKPSEQYSGGTTELDLEDTILLVNNIRAQNPLDILKTDQVIARSSEKKVSDLTVQYDGKSIIFNIAHFNKPGSTIGLWLKMTASDSGVDVKRFYYVCPGSYASRTQNFDAEKCIAHDVQGQRILVPKEDALRCIALDVIYSRTLELKQKNKPSAKILFEKTTNEIYDKERAEAGQRKKKRNSLFSEGMDNIYYISNSGVSDIHDSADSNYFDFNTIINANNRESDQNSLRDTYTLFRNRRIIDYTNRRAEVYEYISDFSDYTRTERTLEEIDHSLFTERFSALPA